MYKKDFDTWNQAKQQIEKTNPHIFFHQREIWWCRLGCNIGFEEDGKNIQFSRPVLILKSYSKDAALIAPLTSQHKTGRYYFNIGIVANKEATAILSQLRFIDKRRLTKKIGILSKSVFLELQLTIVAINFSAIK